MIDPARLGPPPRKIRPARKYRVKRNALFAAAALLGAVLFAILGTISYRRLSLVPHAIPVYGTVAGHHITAAKAARFTLFVDARIGMEDVKTAVDVAPETYEHVWIGDRLDFYLDATDPADTSEDPPSGLKLLGFCLGYLVLGAAVPAGLVLLGHEERPKSEDQRKALENYESGELSIQRYRPFDPVTKGGTASGVAKGRNGRRWKVVGLRLRRIAKVGDEIPVLFDPEEGKVVTLASIVDFELRS